MQALILAGGEGTRLRPLTYTTPKPVMPLAGRPFLSFMLDWAHGHGVDEVILSCGFLSDGVKRVLGDIYDGMRLRYVIEEEPLGTAGPVRLAFDEGVLEERLLVLNGDVLTDLDYADLLQQHSLSGGGLTVAVAERTHRVEYGVLEVEASRIVGFREKPDLRYQVSMGVYWMSRKTLAPYPAGRAFGFDQLVLDLLARGDHPATFPFTGFWLDIGRPEDYDEANRSWDELRPRLLRDREGEPV